MQQGREEKDPGGQGRSVGGPGRGRSNRSAPGQLPRRAKEPAGWGRMFAKAACSLAVLES